MQSALRCWSKHTRVRVFKGNRGPLNQHDGMKKADTHLGQPACPLQEIEHPHKANFRNHASACGALKEYPPPDLPDREVP